VLTRILEFMSFILIPIPTYVLPRIVHAHHRHDGRRRAALVQPHHPSAHRRVVLEARYVEGQWEQCTHIEGSSRTAAHTHTYIRIHTHVHTRTN